LVRPNIQEERNQLAFLIDDHSILQEVWICVPVVVVIIDLDVLAVRLGVVGLVFQAVLGVRLRAVLAATSGAVRPAGVVVV